MSDLQLAGQYLLSGDLFESEFGLSVELGLAADHYLELPGTVGHYAAASRPGVTVGTKINIRALLDLDDWTAAGPQVFASHWGSSASERAWTVHTDNSFFRWEWSEDGVNIEDFLDVPHSLSGRVWVEASFVLSNASGNAEVTFSHSPDGTTWTVIGSDSHVGAATIFNSPFDYRVGVRAEGDGEFPLDGKVHRVEIRIDDLLVRVFDADQFSVGDSAGATGEDPEWGGNWTLTGASSVIQGTGPANALDSEVVWTDVTPWLLEVRGGYGRQNELQRIEAGRADLLLDSPDGRFDPRNPSGPYFGYLRPRMRFRWRASYAGITYAIFHGYVDRWPQEAHEGGHVAEVPASITDGYKILDQVRLGRPYSAEVLDRNPLIYLRLGLNAQDSSGNGHHGTQAGGVTFGVPGALIGGLDAAARFDGVDDQISVPHHADLNLNGFWSIGFFLREVAFANAFPGVMIKGVNTPPNQWLIWIEDQGDGTRRIRFKRTGQDAFASSAFDPTVSHLFGITYDGSTLRFYIDGKPDTTFSAVFEDVTTTESLLVGRGDHRANIELDEPFVTTSVVPEGVWGELWDSRFDEAPAERSDVRVGKLLDLVGMPSAQRDLSVGQSIVAPLTPNDQFVSAEIRLTEDSEEGLFWFGPDGQAVFRDRHHRILNQGAVIASFGDGALPFLEFKEDFGEDWIYNHATVSRDGGGPQVWRDPDSIEEFGPASVARSGLQLLTDAEALAQAQRLVNRYAQPYHRVESIVISGEADPAVWPIQLGAGIGDRIAIDGDEYHIEHIEHRAWADDNVMFTTWQLSPADPQTYWVLGDPELSILGVTTRLF